MNHPTPGQRWSSTTEPELGLGLVMEADVSRVRLFFPAAGELRTYAWGKAPLTRFSVSVGETVTDQHGESFVVKQISDQDGVLVYHGPGRELPESELADRMLSQAPLERLLRGEHDSVEDFELRELLLKKRGQRDQHPATGFLGGRIEFLEHQLAVVQEISQRIHPRVLLADEVGLGKTIEAGLLIHQGVRTGRIQRVLVVVPDALVHQWFVEMLRRFHLTFTIVDEDSLNETPEENPFFDAQLVLCSLGLLTSSKARDWAEQAEWDLMVVDEAHHLTWSPDTSSPEYLAISSIASKVPGLFLLTATPSQLGEETYFGQLHLLDPDRYSSLQEFKQEQSTYVEIADQAALLREKGDTDALKDLLRRHGPSRLLFRNTREHVQGFPKRIAHPILLQTDKQSWLKEFLESHPEEKVLIITQTPQDVRDLATSVQAYLEPPPVQFHEGQPLLERDRQAAWFADPEGSRVMIASDIGGEGRNFQFVRHLVLIDLPQNPERIEQRIGRLDRIGQQAEFHIHIPVQEDEPEAQWMRWHHEGLGAFEHPLSCGQKCFELYRDRLDQVDDDLIAETKQTVETLEQEYRSGPQRLITWKHELARPSESLKEALLETDADPSLLPFAETLWQKLGIETEQLREQEYRCKPGPFFSGDVALREEGFTFTCDRSIATQREDLDLLTWDHPFLLDAWDAVLSSPLGTVAMAQSSDIEAPHLQALFMVEAIAPPQLHLSRFFPPTPLLITVDGTGTSVPSPASLKNTNGTHEAFSSSTFQQKWLPDRLADAEHLSELQAKPLIESAMQATSDQLDNEIERLESLRKINDHVREEELHQLIQQKEDLLSALESMQPRLESLCLILPTTTETLHLSGA